MNRLKELRTEKGIKQAELADHLNVTRQAVSRYETGERDLGTDDIRRLCAYFGCSADYLLGFSSRQTPEISPEDGALLAAYHAATPEIRAIIDTALDPYKEKRQTAAG
jgi:transcriptional regulator with XRE-family HTH domain